MSQKKINGYVIFMKQVLGKGSYGSVIPLLFRYIAASRTEPNNHALSRSYKKASVISISYSRSGRLPQVGAFFLSVDFATFEELKRGEGAGCDGKQPQLLYHSGNLRLRPRTLPRKTQINHITGSHLLPETNL